MKNIPHSLLLKGPHVIQKRTLTVLRKMLFKGLQVIAFLERLLWRVVYDGFSLEYAFVLNLQKLKKVCLFA